MALEELDGLEELHGFLSGSFAPVDEVVGDHVVYCFYLQAEDLTNAETSQITGVFKNFVKQVRFCQEQVDD